MGKYSWSSVGSLSRSCVAYARHGILSTHRSMQRVYADLLDNRQDPGLAVVVTICANAEVDLLRVGVGLVARCTCKGEIVEVYRRSKHVPVILKMLVDGCLSKKGLGTMVARQRTHPAAPGERQPIFARLSTANEGHTASLGERREC